MKNISKVVGRKYVSGIGSVEWGDFMGEILPLRRRDVRGRFVGNSA
jgi:hypothetical protein